MGYKLIYIDDDLENANIFKDGLMTNGLLEISVVKADNFETQLLQLIDLQNDFDGVILDLKLDENQAGDKKARYTAPGLAQQLRSNSLRKKFKKEFPIFLLTSEKNLKRFYLSDTTSHDLFDEDFSKDTNFGTTSKEYEKEIHSIIAAYEKIKNSKNYNNILDSEIGKNIENQVFIKPFIKSSISEKAQFIRKEIILQSGILIDEKILAARLGVDIEASSDSDWDKLKKELKDTEYSGIYSDFYDRWWVHLLNDWWKSKILRKNLASLTAEERVASIRKVLKLKNIVDAKPISKTVSTRFWTICKALQKPLDPNEGFRLRNSKPEPWQDMEYITLQAFLDKKVKPEDIHPSEIERFRDIKNQFSK